MGDRVDKCKTREWVSSRTASGDLGKDDPERRKTTARSCGDKKARYRAGLCSKQYIFHVEFIARRHRPHPSLFLLACGRVQIRLHGSCCCRQGIAQQIEAPLYLTFPWLINIFHLMLSLCCAFFSCTMSVYRRPYPSALLFFFVFLLTGPVARRRMSSCNGSEQRSPRNDGIGVGYPFPCRWTQKRIRCDEKHMRR